MTVHNTQKSVKQQNFTKKLKFWPKIAQMLPKGVDPQMFKQVKKLQRAALKDPVKIQINKKNKSVDTLDQKYIFVPKLDQSTLLVWLLNEYRQASCLLSQRLPI